MLIRLRLKGALRLMSVENLSTGIEAIATGESLNSGDPAVHPAARHSGTSVNATTYTSYYRYQLLVIVR